MAQSQAQSNTEVDQFSTNRQKRPTVIFFGNGPLADATLEVLQASTEIIFHVRTQAELAQAAEYKRQHPEAYGILASFGVLIKPDFLELFEPTGILNLHPSLLPQYRGPSPIESAILAGDNTFGYSIMKLAEGMDAGPLYHQATVPDLPLEKAAIYHGLATAGAGWIVQNLENLPSPRPQPDQGVSYTKKLRKTDSFLRPDIFPAETILRQIIAFQGFPKPKYNFFNQTCIILQAHLVRVADIVCDLNSAEITNSPLVLKCADQNFIVIDQLQPAGKKPMDARSFINGYGHKN